MEALAGGEQKHTFISHVFSTTEEGKAEILNVVQYSLMGVIPIIALNKLIQRFIPEADSEKSSLEILVEVFIQIVVMFCGIIIVHRVITYFPTYSGFKYDNFVLTNVILSFLVIVLSIQTKLGIKVNILVDRLYELWSGSEPVNKKESVKNGVRVSKPVSRHQPSQADFLDSGAVQSDIFPPGPVATSRQGPTYDHMMRGNPAEEAPIMAANTLLGSSFGAF
jgi:hypothetical protein